MSSETSEDEAYSANRVEYSNAAGYKLPEAQVPADLMIRCKECSQTFLFTAGEQVFYAQKGFMGQPTRCKPCREERKADKDIQPATPTYVQPINFVPYPNVGYPMMDYNVMMVPPAQNMWVPTQSLPCHAFQRGNCKYGTTCKFSHDVSGNGFNQQFVVPQANYGYVMPSAAAGFPQKKRNSCFAYQRGQCNYGDTCKYSHDDPIHFASMVPPVSKVAMSPPSTQHVNDKNSSESTVNALPSAGPATVVNGHHVIYQMAPLNGAIAQQIVPPIQPTFMRPQSYPQMMSPATPIQQTMLPQAQSPQHHTQQQQISHSNIVSYNNSERRVCHKFQRGECRFGDTCKFLHTKMF